METLQSVQEGGPAQPVPVPVQTKRVFPVALQCLCGGHLVPQNDGSGTIRFFTLGGKILKYLSLTLKGSDVFDRVNFKCDLCSSISPGLDPVTYLSESSFPASAGQAYQSHVTTVPPLVVKVLDLPLRADIRNKPADVFGGASASCGRGRPSLRSHGLSRHVWTCGRPAAIRLRAARIQEVRVLNTIL